MRTAIFWRDNVHWLCSYICVGVILSTYTTHHDCATTNLFIFILFPYIRQSIYVKKEISTPGTYANFKIAWQTAKATKLGIKPQRIYGIFCLTSRTKQHFPSKIKTYFINMIFLHAGVETCFIFNHWLTLVPCVLLLPHICWPCRLFCFHRNGILMLPTGSCWCHHQCFQLLA